LLQPHLPWPGLDRPGLLKALGGLIRKDREVGEAEIVEADADADAGAALGGRLRRKG
jgi:hypothetical protein